MVFLQKRRMGSRTSGVSRMNRHILFDLVSCPSRDGESMDIRREYSRSKSRENLPGRWKSSSDETRVTAE